LHQKTLILKNIEKIGTIKLQIGGTLYVAQGEFLAGLEPDLAPREAESCDSGIAGPAIYIYIRPG